MTFSAPTLAALSVFALTVFALQGVLMGVDELYFHRRRGLPKWERIGHPVDTLSVFACYAVVLAFEPAGAALATYCVLAIVSCLLVTKDEGIHAEHCTSTEHWLHALLFILHPLVLGGAGLLWLSGQRTPLLVGACLIGTFGMYQALYWNFFADRRKNATNRRARGPLPPRKLAR